MYHLLITNLEVQCGLIYLQIAQRKLLIYSE